MSAPHSQETSAALLAGADASAAMPYPVQHPTQAMKDRRLARLWKTAGAIAHLEDDPGAFRDLLEMCGLLAYEPGESGKTRTEKFPVYHLPVRGQ